MIIYGIKNPDIEDKETLTRYAQRKDLGSENIYTVGADDFLAVENYFGKNFPAIIIFDLTGNYIPYANTEFCNANAFSFIDSLNSNISYEIDSSFSMNDVSSKLRSLDGDYITIEKSSSVDYHIFIFWTRWTGRLNKTHVKIWENSAYSNDKTKVRVYKVNMDFQQYWMMSVEECYKMLEGVTACQPNIENNK